MAGRVGERDEQIVGGRVERGKRRERKREGGKHVGWINGWIKREMDDNGWMEVYE